MRDLLVAFLLFLSGLFILLASLGLKRFPDLYCRLHASCKASTLAKIFSFSAAAIYFWNQSHGVEFKLACVIVFLFFTNPVGTHLIARAGYKRGAKPAKITWYDDYSSENTSS
ncbi:MAG: monovalent cation/H(+) antiporter subunit G [Bdellovibrionota bacterium]